jgi:hypothetical protein
VGEPLTFSIDSSGGKASIDGIKVLSSEGAGSVRCEGGDLCQVEWTPGDAPYPRAVPLFVVDPSRPIEAPLLVVVRLSASPTIPVTTEVGAKVSLHIGDRATETKVAGENGIVRFKVDVQPGDSVANVSLEDKLGNSQTSTILLGGSQGPRVGLARRGSIIEGGVSPTVWVAALTSSGRLWKGDAPLCSGLRGALIPAGSGMWAGTVGRSVEQNIRVECRVNQGVASALVVPLDYERATKLVLHTYPPILSADIPIAEIQAYIVNGAGERLPSDAIRLEAGRGQIERDSGTVGRWVQARYDGTAAAADLGDVIVATWRRPPGSGALWDLAIRGAAPGDGANVLVDARAVDQGGRPLVDAEVTIRVGNLRKRQKTNSYGWATVSLAWPIGKPFVVVEAESVGLKRRTYVLRGDPPTAASGAPDLVAETQIQIRPGRVHGVVLNTSPKTFTNDGMVGTITVLLEDKIGNAVVGPSVEVVASEGVVGEVVQRPNGVYAASFGPPVGMSPGSIRITASTGDGRFSAATDLEVRYRQLDWSIGPKAGFIVGAHGDAGLVTGLGFERRLPVDGLYFRADAARYALTASERDPVTGAEVNMSMSVVPLGLGMVARRGWGRFPLWVGGRMLMAPFHLDARVDGESASNGWGWLSPGAGATTGMGYRLGGGEVFGELDYYFLVAPSGTIGWKGLVGGVVGAIGYKLLY